MLESFGGAIVKSQNKRKNRGITITKEVPKITHQQFADYTILPTESTLKEAQNFKKIINNYRKVSGQKINSQIKDFLY